MDGDWRTVGVHLQQEQEPGGAVVGEVVGAADPEAVRAQVARILSLDVDATGFPAVGQRDPLVGRLQQRYRGLRPVTFWSPYEAAAWTVISQRIRITQASRIKARMGPNSSASFSIPVSTQCNSAPPAPSMSCWQRSVTGADRSPTAYRPSQISLSVPCGRHTQPNAPRPQR